MLICSADETHNAGSCHLCKPMGCLAIQTTSGIILRRTSASLQESHSSSYPKYPTRINASAAAVGANVVQVSRRLFLPKLKIAICVYRLFHALNGILLHHNFLSTTARESNFTISRQSPGLWCMVMTGVIRVFPRSLFLCAKSSRNDALFVCI